MPPLVTKQTTLWSGPFGDQYQERNTSDEQDITNRMNFWDRCVKQIHLNSNRIPQSFLEVGAGQGANLTAIQKLYIQAEMSHELYATEINEKGREKIKQINNVKLIDDLSSVEGIADIVFTMGVLIHVHPAHLQEMLRNIYKASKKWIVCAEYFAPQTRAQPYRGEPDALWLDDFGLHYVKMFPLRVLGYGFLWKMMTGLDNLNFWIMEKTQ